MNIVIQLLAELAEKDIRLWLEDGKLKFSAPEGAMTAHVRDRIVGNKQAIIDFLGQAQKQQVVQIPHCDRNARLAASFAQQRLWFLNRLDPQSPAYNMAGALRLRGELDIAALGRALSEIVARHEVLRTRYAEDAAGLTLQIDPPQALTLQALPLPAGLHGNVDARIDTLAQREAATPFDLAREGVLRVTLYRIDDHDHLLLTTLHHIASDGWSMGVLVTELATLYRAFCQGQASPLPALSLQYTDYAAWQRDWLCGERLEKQLQFWRTTLGDNPVLQLPADKPRPPVPGSGGDAVVFEIDHATTSALNQLAREHGATLFMVLMCAFRLLLARYCRQHDITIGTPVAGRALGQLEALIGCFINTVAIRSDVSGCTGFIDALQRERSAAQAAFDHQDVPFEQVVDALNLARDMAFTPVFQVMFALQNAPANYSTSLPGLDISAVDAGKHAAMFDLKLSMNEVDGRIVSEFEYRTDLFERASIERLAAHFSRWLATLAQSPATPLAQLNFLSADEQRFLHDNCNNAVCTQHAPQLIHRRFEQAATQFGDRIAVSCEQEHITYRALNERANQIAHALIHKGVRAGDFVGLALERSIDLLASILGIAKAGAAYVPLDPHFPADRLAYIYADANARALISTQAIIDQLRLPADNALLLDRDATLLQTQPHHDTDITQAADSILYVLYTSGTTGKPKGCLVTHANVSRLMSTTESDFGFNEHDRWTLFHSYAFDFTVWEMWGALLYGGELVVVPYYTARDSDAFYALLRDRKITVLNQTPSAFSQLIAIDALQADNSAPLSLRYVVFGGEALDFPALRTWARRHGLAQPKLINMYGITETTVHVTRYTVTQADLEKPRSIIGRPITDLQLHIVSPELALLPVGVPGEIVVSGPGVTRGYLQRPELTAEKFVANPFVAQLRSTLRADHATLYRSGDLAVRLPSGDIEYLGRIDQQVKIRGHRIELGEIEAALGQQPGIREAVVLAREAVVNSGGAKGDVRLTGYLLTDTHTPIDTNVLREALKAFLPDYMIPSAFVTLTQWPLTPTGKVDKKALPAPDMSTQAREYVAPRNELEQKIAAVFSDVLGVAQVGIHDNFFELGGHSLLATQVVSRLRNLTTQELPLRALFLDPTVAGIAQALQHTGNTNLPPLQPVARTADSALPLSFAQQRLWLIDQLAPNSALYNIPLAVKISGRLDIDALERAFAEVVRRHDSLRTRFVADASGNARQIIEPYNGFTLAQAPGASDRGTLEQQVFAFMAQPFQLGTAPLMRALLLTMPQHNEYILLACLHHIITDGWSMDVLLHEIATLYTAFSQHKPSPLPELALQYADFALWQHAVAATGYYEQQTDYWKKQLANVPVLQLPTDKLRPAMLDAHGRVIAFEFDATLAAGIRQLAQIHGVTLYQTLLAAFQLLLARYSGQSDIATGTPVANRQQAALEPIIGFFVNTLVMRTQVDNTQSFTSLLQQVRDTTVDAYQHQDLPFEQLIEALRVPRDLSTTPLFQVMFILQSMMASGDLQQNARFGDVTLSSVREGGAYDAPAKFDMTMSLVERDGKLHGELEYRSSLWLEDTMQAFCRSFETLLRGIVADPSRAVGDYALLTDSEMTALMSTQGNSWNATEHALPQVNALHTIIEQQVERTPNAAAVSYNGNTWTYTDLNRKSNQLAHYLRELGVAPGALVGVCIERGLDMSLALLATLKAGAAYVPFDPTFPADRLGFMLDDTAVAVMLTASHLTQVLPSPPQHVLCLDRDGALWATMPEHNPNAAVAHDNLFNVIFTSGSTGKPKGVMVPHIGIINRLLWMQDMYPLQVGDRVLQKTPYSFDVSVWELFWPLLVGAEIVYARPEGHKDPDYLCELIRQERIGTLHFVPSMLGIFLQNDNVSACTTIKRVFCSGEALQLAHEKRFFEKLPHAELHNLYGPTEASVDVSYYACSPHSPYRSVPIGKPVWNTQLHVLDTQLQPVPVGVVGELYIGGIQLAHGYLKRDELTRTTFIDNPHFVHGHPSKKLYKTGDLARYLPDGNIEYIGRVDFQVKVRGLRIELGEIETVLMRHPLVKEAIVVVQDLGDRNVIIVAYFVPQNPHAVPDAQALRAFLKQDLPVYMLPNVYMALDEIPLSANGKANRKALPAPDLSQMARTEYVAPRDELETALAAIFAAALDLDKVGINDNFFELGGHSLTATQIMARVKAQYPVQLDVRTLFEAPTLAEFATLLRDAMAQQNLLIDDNSAADDEEEFTL